MNSMALYFDELYRRSDDPWKLREGWYERRKRALTLAMLPRPRYRNAFEPGCANGELTLELARRCDALLAADLHGRAVQLTRERVARGLAADTPGQWTSNEEAGLAAIGAETGTVNGVLYGVPKQTSTDAVNKDANRDASPDVNPQANPAEHSAAQTAQVRVEQRTMPRDWPAESGPFDLIVISELAYYLDTADLQTLAARIAASLTTDGTLLACHWRRPFAEALQSAEAAHAVLDANCGLARLAHHEEADLLIDVWSRDPRSVAQREGLR